MVLVLAGSAVGILAEFSYSRVGVSALDLARDVMVGWAFIAAGLVAWWRQPRNPTGSLMVATGFAWFVGNFEDAGLPILFSLAYWLSALNVALLAHLILAFPEGRLNSRGALLIVVTAYLVVGLVGFADMATYGPKVGGAANYLCGNRCPTNPLLLLGIPGLHAAVHSLYYGSGVPLGAATIWLIVQRWRSATSAGRRFLTPIWVSMCVLIVIIATDATIALGSDLSAPYGTVLIWLSDVGQMAVPLAFLFGLLRMQLDQAAVGKLVIELGNAPPPPRLRDALARTLGDPSLQLAFWASGANRYVTPEGLPIELSAVSSRRAITLVEQQERPLAALIHDPALASHPGLVNAVRAAAGLGVENERLHAELRARLEEVSVSRRRILDAADAERRRIERNLHDGAQQRLISVSLTLGLAVAQLERHPGLLPEATPTVSRALAELRSALDELRDLARGIHPAILVQQGLCAAITSLAEAAPVPVRVSVPRLRYPLLTESIAYYVACEAVANAVRHAHASSVEVRVEASGSWLNLQVADDGIGGANVDRGTGLLGLADRVATLGGRFEVTSRPGQGTCIRAALPCESREASGGEVQPRDRDRGSR